MSRARSIIRSSLTLLTVVVCIGCYNRFDDPTASEGVDIVTNITTEELSRVLSADGYVDIDQEIKVRGNVSAHDESGNFYKSFVIENNGYGVEILEGLTDSYVRHQLGAEIVVDLNGLRVSRSRGVVQIGTATESSSYYSLDYLGHPYLVDQHITNTGYTSLVEPREFTLAELAADPELATSLCGSLIRVTGVRYYPTDSEDDDGIWSGERRFIDATDPLLDDEPSAAIWCYTSSYSTFSERDIPTNMGTLTGILQGDYIEGGSGWEMMIKPRGLDDLSF